MTKDACSARATAKNPVDWRKERENRSIIAYEYFRDEIKREDSVTGQRVTYSLSLQGLLIASVTLLLSNGVSKDVPTRELLVQLRQVTLLGIIGLGFFFSIISAVGIEASLRSITKVIASRKDALATGKVGHLNYLPQSHGEKSEYILGRLFPVAIIGMFGLFWAIFGGFYIVIVLEQHRIPFLPLEAAHSECLKKAVTTASAGTPAQGRTTTIEKLESVSCI